MTRIRSLALWLVALGVLCLAGCADRKGDLGAVFEEDYHGPRYADPDKSGDLANWLAQEGQVSRPVGTGVMEATPVAMSPAPPAVVAPGAAGVLARPAPEASPAPSAAPEVAALEPAPPPVAETREVAPETVAESPKPESAVAPETPATERVELDAAASVPVAAAVPDLSGEPAAPGAADVSAGPAPVAAEPAAPVGGPVAAPVADPPAPPAPPAEETPEQRAERLLKEARRLASTGDRVNMAEAEAECEAGVKLFNDLEYEQAQRHFEAAVRLNPALERANEYLRKTRALLGIRADRLSEKLRSLERVERVRIQEQLVVIGAALEEARGYEERGSEVDISVADSGKEQVLAAQLDSLREAQSRYRRVKEILNWMPPHIAMPAERRVVEEALGRVHQKIAEKEDEISFLRREQAAKAAEDARVRETELFKQRIAKMLEQVEALYYAGEYTAAEKLSLRVIQLDPLNTVADNWKRKARAAYHVAEKGACADEYQESLTQTWEAGEAAHIPYGDLIVYPPNWDQIARRGTTTAIGKTAVEEQWKVEIKKRLQRRVSFEFVDTPLQEAINFLRSLTNVTMIIDPQVLEGGPPTINLRVTDMPLELALGWILRLAELDYALKDKAIYISKPSRLIEDVDLRIYDVSDLTLTIQDMPGPDLQVQTVDPTDASVAGGIQNPFVQQQQQPTVTAASIKDMIRLHVKPESWDPQQGTSIEERSGRLVVMQRPEVHALIDQLLANFRATQKILVNIESRFVTLRESNLESIGVDFQGLNPYYGTRGQVDQYGRTIRGLAGDYGDLTRTGLAQPRTATSDNAPWPGFTKNPTTMHGAIFSTVGAIVNSVVNFSGDPDAIGQDTIQNGGLAAQMLVLSDPQYQMFIRAVGARENQTVLMNPRLTCYNTQRAHMFVARQKSYIADYEISGDAYDPIIRQFLAGVVLDVRPTVSSDRRYVTMELRGSLTELDGPIEILYLRVLSFFDTGIWRVAYSVWLPIQFPNLTIRRVRTTVSVPDGGIIFLGGLYRNVKYMSENGVPFLSDLPVVGRLFRWNVEEKARSNLAILVSPKIILFSEEEGKL